MFYGAIGLGLIILLLLVVGCRAVALRVGRYWLLRYWLGVIGVGCGCSVGGLSLGLSAMYQHATPVIRY